jgi:hypothetical protein
MCLRPSFEARKSAHLTMTSRCARAQSLDVVDAEAGTTGAGNRHGFNFQTAKT